MTTEFLRELSTDCVAAVGQQKLYERMSFDEYLALVRERPGVACSAFERLYEAILCHGTREIDPDYGRDKKVRYKVFDDPFGGGKDAIFGLTECLMELVNVIKAAKCRYGSEKRIILLDGPVGCAKSTIAHLLKRALEWYSLTEAGGWYSFEWTKDSYCAGSGRARQIEERDFIPCPLQEEPLRLIPEKQRALFLEKMGLAERIAVKGDLCPFCRLIFRNLMGKYRGDFYQLLQENVRICRMVHSEIDRVGIGTFQPRDEKNQDSTDLTGAMNYRNIVVFGSESDPRAFSFDGEFLIANRGLIEFVEVLKLDVAFLYDLLGATQEHKVKPKKFPQIDIDEVIIGHTNEPEYRKLQNNEFMEALRDRTVRVRVYYTTKLDNELAIYKRDYNERTVKSHLAPHALEVAAMWAVLSRLEQPRNANLTLLQKLKLYNGKTLPGFTRDSVKELREEAKEEGRFGVSPRYVQDKLSNALVAYDKGDNRGCLNPFMVLNELERGLESSPLITSQDARRIYKELIGVVKGEYENIVKAEVQQAIAADEDQMKRLAANYIDNVKAYTQREKVKDKFTGDDRDPDERLMRSVEEKIEIPDSRKDDFRREIMNYIGALAIDGKVFDYKSNERLYKALQLKLFEDQKDTIKLSTIAHKVVDEETQKKIEVVKERMKKMFGYQDECAADVLDFVAGIFARGAVKEDKKK